MNPFISWIEAPAPRVSAAEAQALAERHYGIRASAHGLHAERDRNFRLEGEDGRNTLLKISNADAAPGVVSFQVRALLHVARADPGLPVPRLLAGLHGGITHTWQRANGDVHLVRMLSWLDGECVELPGLAAEARRETGRCLARLGRALAGCDPAGASRDLPWDLGNTHRYRDLTAFIEDPEMAALVRDRLDRFDTRLRPALGGLRRQVIHNDLNPDNVLFEPGDPGRISGIIDFGDMIEAPLVFDLAVAGAYQLSGGPDPLSDLLPLVSGYHSVTPLRPAELEVLLPLVECRLLATYLIQGTRAAERAAADEDCAGSSARAAARLRTLAGISPGDAAAFFRAAC